ncbi:MAG: hypothetical protein ABIT01_03905, partial [Thermoanaerobaculia bacterium]
RGFADEGREFLRLLVWLPRPFPAPRRFATRAAAAAEHASLRLANAEPFIRRRFGLSPNQEDVGVGVGVGVGAASRLALVLEMLRGVPPGVLARRERIPEPDLYRWRDEALAAGLSALSSSSSRSSADPLSEDARLERALEFLCAESAAPPVR